MEHRIKKYACFFAALFVFFIVVPHSPIRAEEYHFDGSQNGWDDVLEELPEEIQNELDGFRRNDPIDSANSLQEKVSITYWINKISGEFLDVFTPSLRTAFSILGMLIIIASVRLLSDNLMGSSFEKMFELCCDISVASVVVSVAETMITTSSAYLTRLCGIMNAMIPVTEMIYLTEGSVSQMAIHKSAMLLYIAVTSNLNNILLKPMFGILFGFSVSGTVFEQFGISGFIEGFKKFVMTLISLFTLLFSFILGLQTVLAKSADSLALKTARLALGSFIPIIGGTLSEALTTVKEGFGVIRSVAGVGGIVIILLLILPTAVSLFTNNMILSFCHMAAEIMGCGNSARIIGGIKSVLSILCAIVYATTLLFIMAMIIFAKGKVG